MSNEKKWSPFKTSKSLSPKLVWYNSRIKLKFKESCLKQEDKAAFTIKNVINLFIVYELDTWLPDLSAEFTLKDCSLGAVNVTKNADTDKCKYSSYEIAFDLQSPFSLPDVSIRKSRRYFWS